MLAQRGNGAAASGCAEDAGSRNRYVPSARQFNPCSPLASRRTRGVLQPSSSSTARVARTAGRRPAASGEPSAWLASLASPPSSTSAIRLMCSTAACWPRVRRSLGRPPRIARITRRAPRAHFCRRSSEQGVLRAERHVGALSPQHRREVDGSHRPPSGPVRTTSASFCAAVGTSPRRAPAPANREALVARIADAPGFFTAPTTYRFRRLAVTMSPA